MHPGETLAPAPGEPVKSPDMAGAHAYVCPVDGQRYVLEAE